MSSAKYYKVANLQKKIQELEGDKFMITIEIEKAQIAASELEWRMDTNPIERGARFDDLLSICDLQMNLRKKIQRNVEESEKIQSEIKHLLRGGLHTGKKWLSQGQRTD
ncbi:hypothetical protein CAPTEDRAFT_197562 [Capitella teleta]|uniref:Uncharacterized protein n=1 Tax=Capitella teleta TaxID=283909 RepID=R7TVV3_CAPTE|nr:hypothetical protein CAPTEDRAFT_197562 [Capitella teleta]|eukprot:ELT98038.1 hypothetical protein CAPTEDRAFT_197562 [Capitella teleta]